ncbi:uncharacterized protein B0H64DRAFT_408435 [Chaetomium fimeti]|uniref:Uncharacterized protein n=1 Tax=Chaetomium fimeti TaxID=1854472 RepID=A0AAE0LNQ5_9PEZI|nr:hypothetical protein B0H64DRAFT_408435 [Chaetomium fimeti]
MKCDNTAPLLCLRHIAAPATPATGLSSRRFAPFAATADRTVGRWSSRSCLMIETVGNAFALSFYLSVSVPFSDFGCGGAKLIVTNDKTRDTMADSEHVMGTKLCGGRANSSAVGRPHCSIDPTPRLGRAGGVSLRRGWQRRSTGSGNESSTG